MSQVKNGELLIIQGDFTRLRCIHTPCLSTWLHLRFSYRVKILLVVVSIVSFYQKYIIYDKVQALSWTGRYPVAWTVRNLWRILAYTQGRRGRVKVDAYEILIDNTNVSYLPLSEMGHMAMLHLNFKKFSQLKGLFEVNLNQTNSLIFRLTGSTTTASAFAIFEERSMICIFQAVKSST